MAKTSSFSWKQMDRLLRRNDLISFGVIVTLLVDVFWGRAVALSLPLGYLALRAAVRLHPSTTANSNKVLLSRPNLIRTLDSALNHAKRDNRVTGALMLGLDNIGDLPAHTLDTQQPDLENILLQRVRDALHPDDQIGLWAPYQLTVLLAKSRRTGRESALQLAEKIQRSIAYPIPVGEGQVTVTVSVGIGLSSRSDDASGVDLLRRSAVALMEAQRNGPASIRSYSEHMHHRIEKREQLSQDISAALDSGEICAHFQPQVHAETGEITGFEALARWFHPKRGLIPPSEFLPALEHSGQMPRLGAVMVRDALRALECWKAHGFDVPQVGVNLSPDELCDPSLVDRISFELERFHQPPQRLAIEVLETVVATSADTEVVRNLTRLSELGCKLDLDDFGTGHASITNIRMFSINRIKIDRSFVTGIDGDLDKQDMVSTILMMAERLGLDTLAEGAETGTDLTRLAELGCHHVQGFGIARPMTFADTLEWLTARLGTQAPHQERQNAV